MGPEPDEITWSGELWGVLFVYFFLIRKHNMEIKEQEIYEGCLGAEKSMWDNLTKTVALRQIFC